MLWGLLMMLLILFERFLFALSFGLIFLCLYNIKLILAERGVALLDSTCYICGIAVESTTHVLADCLVVRSIWWNVFVWLKLLVPTWTCSIQSLLESGNKCDGPKDWKKVIGAMCLTTC
ncbi:hypothetical protein HanXRQr2_Chr03g0087961 [Helianthus annuus]|uniref:Reverse transcriptase zinc-binding domain-containing protein n=1 Tax=Helianthus annuus TaxID=4232 RepID=A0A251V4E7_HELAN|nr:hypothetical protein HanXRQr2_Chr03g0087961 [Helianthus annuus]